jgi:AraC-like DNA-binding protein
MRIFAAINNGKVISMIKRHITKPISTPISRPFPTRISTNRSYFFDAIKAVTGKTLKTYIYALRPNEAGQMMDNHPDLTVKTISEDSGFDNRQIFHRLFKEQYNISPAQYCKMAKNRL